MECPLSISMNGSKIMPAPDYRQWKIIGHNGVAKAGCSITQPIMERNDGTITLLSLGPYGGLTRDPRDHVQACAAQGLLTLFSEDCSVQLPPASEDQQEVYPLVLSISREFKKEIAPDPEMPSFEGMTIAWKYFSGQERWIACLANSVVDKLREQWGKVLCARFDIVFTQEHGDWDRLERIAGFGLEIARAKGLRESIYRRYCMAMLVRDDGPPPERAQRIFNAFVIREFRTLNWSSYKSEIQELHQDLLARRRCYFSSLNVDQGILDYFRLRIEVASRPSSDDADGRVRSDRAIRLNEMYQLQNVEAVKPT